MSRHKPTKAGGKRTKLHNTRIAAREQILAAANVEMDGRAHNLVALSPFPQVATTRRGRKKIVVHKSFPTKFTMRHINQAVAVCRRFGLVKPAVLAKAGFNS